MSESLFTDVDGYFNKACNLMKHFNEASFMKE